ncbi:MAG: type II 3-dehydroquinate dehydratase [Bacteroidales bacterium]
MTIQILNGPNLNLIGQREKDIYGNIKFEDYIKLLKELFTDFEFLYYQSNVEGEIVNKIQQAGKETEGIVINAGAYTHTSVAIRDAITAIKVPVVEVHISNIYDREEFRHKSLLAPKCNGSVIGFGLDGYRLAIEALRFIRSQKNKY